MNPNCPRLGERPLARARCLGQRAWLEGTGTGAVRADRSDTFVVLTELSDSSVIGVGRPVAGRPSRFFHPITCVA
jgi:hypothetical protein